MEERLRAGDIDLFIGINTTPHADYEIETLASEGIMLVISEDLLAQNFSRNEIQSMYNGVNLNHFSHVPFTLSFRTGKVNHAIEEYLNNNNIQLKVIYNISDSKTQIQLCATGICVSPYMRQNSLQRHGRLHAFPINHFDQNIHIDLVSHKNVSHPLFIRLFIRLLREEIPAIARTNLLQEL